jgi:NAD(P)-dependent dehydrogenase (short-subunit alcohol dehydrogenase family)
MTNQRVALITGGNRGIGYETARQLGQQDVIVILTARKLAAAQNSRQLNKQ